MKVPPPSDPPVDLQVVAGFTAGDLARARQLVVNYCEMASADVETLAGLLRRSHHDAMRLAHRIRGSATMVGAREVAAIVKRIERDAGSPSVDIDKLLEELRRAVARVGAWLATLP